MATRKQKRTTLLWASMCGGIAGTYLNISVPVLAESPLPAYGFAIAGALLACWLGYQLIQRLGAEDDTVVYHLRRRGRVVYVGVAYARRVGSRIAEHKRSGKRFDRVDLDKPRPRSEALEIEADRIRRWQPRYNVAGKPAA